MTAPLQIPATTTEAAAQSVFGFGWAEVVDGFGQNTGRVVPYAEIYHQSSAVMKTPVEDLQEAAEHEKRAAEPV